MNSKEMGATNMENRFSQREQSAFLLVELVSCYFLVASIVYWIRNGG